MMCSLSLGRNVDLIEIIEFHAPTHDARWMLPGLSPHQLETNASWLRERFWTPRTNRLVFTYQLWLLKMPDALVLIDTGCGNHKHRISPYQNEINTPVLDWLAAMGAPAERVTHVLHTHLHSDHVGWNTRLLDGRWVPTFPNATYYLPKLDYDLFTQRRARSMEPEMYEGAFADSVTPVFEAGMTRFVAEGDEVAGLAASATPGHTPGHLAYTLRLGGDEFVFCGDVLHSPLQVICPHLNSRWCEEPDLARASRHKLLRRAAERNATLIPAHAMGVNGWRIGRTAEGFSIGFDTPEKHAMSLHPSNAIQRRSGHAV
jgi:glyoxylase-like metal-dependent hydrolase (beta-lactamase superfamily II)